MPKQGCEYAKTGKFPFLGLLSLSGYEAHGMKSRNRTRSYGHERGSYKQREQAAGAGTRETGFEDFSLFLSESRLSAM